MSDPPVRLPPTVVTVETEPLRPRHWAAMVALALVVAAAWWFSVDRASASLARVTMPPWYELARDDPARAAGLAASSAAPRADVIILGTSLALTALWPDGQLRRAALLSGHDIRFLNLGSGDQSVLETLFLTYGAGLHDGQLLVLVASPRLLASWPDQDSRLRGGLLLVSPISFAGAFQHEIARLRAWLTPVARHRSAFALERQLVHRAVYDRLHSWSVARVYGQRGGRRRVRGAGAPADDGADLEVFRRNTILRFDANGGENAHILDVLANYVRARGARLIVVEAPRLVGDERRGYGPVWPSYRAAIEELSHRHDLRFSDFDARLALGAQEFRDGRHLTDAGRDRWSRAFLDEVMAWCADRRLGPPGWCR